MNSVPNRTPARMPAGSVPSRRNTGMPRNPIQPSSSAVAPTDRRPACRIGEMPALATLIPTWPRPQRQQRKVASAAADTGIGRASSIAVLACAPVPAVPVALPSVAIVSSLPPVDRSPGRVPAPSDDASRSGPLPYSRLCFGGCRMSGPAGSSKAGGGALFAFAATLIWGIQFPVAKASFAWVDAFHGTLFRYAAPTLVLVVALLWREGRSALRMDRRAARAGLLGVVGMCCSPALVLGGLTFTRPEVVAVIVATQPATTALAGWLVFGRRPARFTLACVIFAFFGAITVITRWNPSLAPSAPGCSASSGCAVRPRWCWAGLRSPGPRWWRSSWRRSPPPRRSPAGSFSAAGPPGSRWPA